MLFVVIKLASPGLMCSPEEAGGWAEALNAGMAKVVLVTEWAVLIFRHYNECIFKCNIGPDLQVLLLCDCKHHNNFVFQMTVEFF